MIELREVVAGGGLHELAAGADDLAGGQHRFEAEHLVAGDAVLHRAHAAGVRGDVAAEARAVLARVDGVGEAERRERLVELGEGDAGLHDGDEVLGVDLEDLVHRARTRSTQRVGSSGCTRRTGRCRCRGR